MCRHAAYLGPAIGIDTLTHGFTHDLTHQSYQPRELLTGVVCADGFGVGWYDDSVRMEPARYANPLPIWADRNLPSMGPLIRSEAIMAAVRNATVAGTSEAANCAPFASGKYLLSLNGYLSDFPAKWQGFMQDHVAPERQQRIAGATDSEWLLQMILTRIDQDEDIVAATQSTLRDVVAHANSMGIVAQLNILLMDGERLVATRGGNQPRSNSLYLLRDGDDMPDSVVVASEPLMDNPEWEAVKDQSLLVLQAGAPPIRLAA